MDIKYSVGLCFADFPERIIVITRNDLGVPFVKEILPDGRVAFVPDPSVRVPIKKEGVTKADDFDEKRVLESIDNLTKPGGIYRKVVKAAYEHRKPGQERLRR